MQSMHWIYFHMIQIPFQYNSFRTKFVSQRFQEGIKRSFIKTGCFHDDGKFVEFRYSTNLLNVKFEPKGTIEEFPDDADRLDEVQLEMFLQDELFEPEARDDDGLQNKNEEVFDFAAGDVGLN